MLRMMIGAALLACMAMPAQAADEKTLGCVYEQFDANLLKLLDSDTEVMMRTTPGEAIPPSPRAVSQGVASATTVCMARYGWSTSAAEAAARYARAKASMPASARILRELGIDPAPIDELYFRIPQDIREIEMTDPRAAAEIEKLASEALRRNLFPAGEARRVGRYMGGRNMMDVNRAAFLRN
jgi:hypothetical protein